MDMSAAATRYLLTIYRLSGEGTPVRSVEIARALEVSPASVVHMLGVLVGAEMTAATLCHGQLTFPAGCRGSLSVFAAGGVAEGVTIRGLQYPLEGGRLTGGETLGVSNAFLGEQAAVSVDRGCLLVVWASQSVLPVWSGLDSHQAIP